jgi:hypothetical protein
MAISLMDSDMAGNRIVYCSTSTMNPSTKQQQATQSIEQEANPINKPNNTTAK